MKERSFLALAVARGRLQREQAKELQVRHAGSPLEALLELMDRQVAPKEELCRIYGDSLGTAYVDLARTLIQSEVVRLIPRDFARAHQVIAIYRFGDAINVAAADPLNLEVLDEVARLAGLPVSAVFSLPTEIADAIEVEYGALSIQEELKAQADWKHLFLEDNEATPERLAQMAGHQNVISLTRQLLLGALKERASDIHIEPSEHEVRVRMRIDGELQERFHLDRRLLQSLVSRFKLMAGCDIVERRRPQDGRIAFALASGSVDVRFSSVPAITGEKLVLRVLGSMQGRSIPALEELGMSASNLATLEHIVGAPNGVFFVTGPTGSGKTTTLYAVLKHLNRPGLNLMTVEDPVEYRLPGANQVQVNPAVGLTFATALRAFLRQDPNIILVGEVRDTETARIVSQAALTGHFVLSTMHTNNALQAVTRLVEIGVEPFLVAPSIIGVSAQRLVRRICPACREEVRMPEASVRRYFGDVGQRRVNLFHGRGCDACHGSGYAGRLAIHEIFMLTDEVRRLIARNASILDIQALALAHGYRPMLYDGLKKALRGLTSLEEVERVTTQMEENR